MNHYISTSTNTAPTAEVWLILRVPGSLWTCPFCHGQARKAKRYLRAGTMRDGFRCECGMTFDMEAKDGV